MGKVSLKRQDQRLNYLIYGYWEIYRRGDFYRNAFRKFERDKKVLGKLGKADFNHLEYKNLIQDFNQRYHIPPINPKWSWNEIDTLYRDFVKKGYDEPFPLEVLFFKGKQNIPIWTHRNSSSRIFIPKLLSFPLSFYMTHLDTILRNRNIRVKGARTTPDISPFIKPPDIYPKGIFLDLNLKATEKTILTAVKNILLSEGAKEQDTRGRDFRKLLTKLTIFDLKKGSRNISFKRIAYATRLFLYPKKSVSEIIKILSDDYNDMTRLINPGKKKANRRKKDFSQIEFKDYGLEYIGSDYTSVEILRLEKAPGFPKDVLHDKKEAKKMSPATIYTPDRYSQDFLKKLIPS